VPPVRRVDVDEDGPDLCRRDLDDDPFGVVRGPDPDPVAALDAERQQAARTALDLLVEGPVRPADALMTRDKRLAISASQG